jgi:hypothetical protein
MAAIILEMQKGPTSLVYLGLMLIKPNSLLCEIHEMLNGLIARH